MPPGIDFAADLAAGLVARLDGFPPTAIAEVELFVNTTRLARAVQDTFAAGPPSLLPRLRLLTSMAHDPASFDISSAVDPLRRRLELTRLMTALIDADPSVAPRAAAFDLADSLAALLDEMHGEGVDEDTLARLDVSDESGHWHRTLSVLRLVAETFRDDAPDVEARQRRVVEAVVDRWSHDPPRHPVIVAGSTGSRGTTAMLMEAVASLPQGAVVLPGVDLHQPASVWAGLTNAMTGEDHPQYRFARLFRTLQLDPGEIRPWAQEDPRPHRNRLISLALRPAPVTDEWRRDGPLLGDLAQATRDLSLIEAPDTRLEALAIALRLRQAAFDGERAALITPDRTLTRQVTAALGRWSIEPDDSAGTPLSQTAPGRLLRMIANMMGQTLTPEPLLAILKHPLVHTGENRGHHLRLTREFELWSRRHGPPFPDGKTIRHWAQTRDDADIWCEWLRKTVFGLHETGSDDLGHLADALRQTAERLAQGPGGAGTGTLWEGRTGQSALAMLQRLERSSDAAGPFDLRNFNALIDALLSREEVRDPVRPHPGILIWGPQEARLGGVDLAILAGLSDGVWPQMPGADPWLNRRMRHDAGLLLPERRIGLSAHDFQQAAGQPKVVLSRSVRDDGAETVPSRWLNRILNLVTGLPDGNGPEALTQMRARGQIWLDRARALDARRLAAPRAGRPAPIPPIATRPSRLSVTRVERLVRDPYAIYAADILNLRPLDPLRQDPDAPLRGSVIHDIFERFIGQVLPDAPDAMARLTAIADAVLEEKAPWPAVRALWRARIDRVARWFVTGEIARRQLAEPVVLEGLGEWTVPQTALSLVGKADRIDRRADGRLSIIDYKTGAPPSKKQINHFDRQLLIEALMAEAGAFPGVPATEVAEIVHIGLGNPPKEQRLPMGEPGHEPPLESARILSDLQELVRHFEDPNHGYPARRAMERMGYDYGFDHLARRGEWEDSDPSSPERL